jgi:hypothetical protein
MRGNFPITVKKKVGTDSAETISDITHLKKITQDAEEHATANDIVPTKEEMTGGKRSTTIFVFLHEILFGQPNQFWATYKGE